MIDSLKLIFTAFLSFLIIDYIWLNHVAKKFYVNQIGELGRIENGQFQPVLWAAFIVYVLLALGIDFLVLPLVSQQDGLMVAFTKGALLGLVVYGVYDFTNLSTLKHWPLVLVGADVLWGTFVTGLVSVITQYVRTHFI